MKQLTLSVVLVICGVTVASAQTKTYFGLEASIFSDRSIIYDNGEWLESAIMTDPMGGGHVRQEVGKDFFWEAGVVVKPYWRGYNFKSFIVPVLSVNYFSWLIPLRAGKMIDLHHDKIFLVPVIGYSLGIQPQMQLRQSSGVRRFNGNLITYADRENGNVSRQFSLVQAGVGVEFKFFRRLLWSINTNYYKGFNTITRIDITYSVNGGAPTTGTATAKGDFWSVGTALRYPIATR